jgi:ATP-binding cassette subfamily F protein uup
VVTSIIAWEGDPEFGGKDGLWREYEGGITDWLTQRERARVALAVAAPPPPPMAAPAAPLPSSPTKVKRSYKEQREFDALPARIEALESEQKAIGAELADGSIFSRDADRAAVLLKRHAQIDDELLAALERWEKLGG